MCEVNLIEQEPCIMCGHLSFTVLCNKCDDEFNNELDPQEPYIMTSLDKFWNFHNSFPF